MPELTAVPMDETDREQLALLLRDAGHVDADWVASLAVRYDLAKSIAQAEKTRPERVARVFACNPDESAGAYEISDPKHQEFHSVHADLWDSRDK